MSQEPDQVIAGKYRLVRRLARGGMGAVWLAQHLELQTEVALKFLRTEEGQDPKSEARFRREARAAAQLKSPHVVHIHDFGIDSGVAYLAMELLHGEDLDEHLQHQGALPLDRAIDIAIQAAKGLRAAHEAGLIHRDIKPGNLFLARLGQEEVIKLLDFGIAKGPNRDDGETTTQGLIFGSPAYMSPEQARGGHIDARSDLWSLAGVLYRSLTGASPFEGANASDIVVKLCTEDVTPATMRDPRLPSEVDAFFRRALSRDPAQRFADVDAFVEALLALRLLAGAPKAEGSERAFRTSASAGRTEETAPLPAAEQEASPASRLRASLAPERPAPSTSRGRWALRGLLIILGLGGTWVVHGTSRGNMTKPGARPDPTLSSTPAPPKPSPTQGADTKAPVATPVPASEPVETPAPAPPQSSDAATPPAPAAPRKKPASRSQRTPVERPPTDPVFGLPVDSP